MILHVIFFKFWGRKKGKERDYSTFENLRKLRTSIENWTCIYD